MEQETKHYHELCYHEERQEDGQLAVVIDGCNLEVRKLHIPEEIMGLPVVGISDNAMWENDLLEEVWLPKCVTQLGEYPFSVFAPLRVHLFHHIRDKALGLKENQLDWQEERIQDSSSLDYEEDCLECRYFVDREQVGIYKLLENRVNSEIPDNIEKIPVVGISDQCFFGAHFDEVASYGGKVLIPESVRYIGIDAFRYAHIHCSEKEMEFAGFVLPAGDLEIEEDAFVDIEVLTDWRYIAGRTYQAACIEIHPGQEKLKGFPWGATKVRYREG